MGGIADRQCGYANVACDQHASGPFHRRVSAGTLKRQAVNVVDMGRPIDADRNGNVVSLETIQPFIIDQQAIGGYRDRYVAARSRRYGFAGHRSSAKILHPPQQGLAAMQNNGQFGQGIPDDVFFDAPQ
jgi:hypothetical protein